MDVLRLTDKTDFIRGFDECVIKFGLGPVSGGVDPHIVTHVLLLVIFKLLLFPYLIQSSFL